MATAGLGVLALVAGAAGGIAALVSDDTQVVSSVGQAAPVVDLPAAEVPPVPPSDATGLGIGPTASIAGRAQAERQADDTSSALGEADRTTARTPHRPAPVDRARPAVGNGGAVSPGTRSDAPAAPAAGGIPAAPSAGDRPDSPAVAAAPAVRKQQLVKTQAIPFRTRTVADASLAPGDRAIEAPGVPGRRLVRYEVTYRGNHETGRRLLGAKITQQPRDRVVAVGPPAGQDRDDFADEDPDQGECRLLSACVQMDPDDVCPEGTGSTEDLALGESIISGDLSALDLSDIDTLELMLPCESGLDEQDGEPGE